jgi:hypothetical protein
LRQVVRFLADFDTAVKQRDGFLESAFIAS